MAATKTAPRRRNAATTRAAILESARRAFVARGYDGAGVREIAEGAGVTAMLVNRYFGSKEKLFAEVVAAAMAAPSILTQENVHAADAGARIAREMVAATAAGATPLDGFLIMLRSASSERAAEIGQVEIGKRHERTLVDAMSGRDAAVRAALVLALTAGLQVMRQMIALPALAKAEPAVLQRMLAPVIQLLLRGP
ncbi:hypothetical protein sos41_18020 [Alphaproteobacteria bacterium SO-S41]|nr:hypothetical protein sos41_18020 [Alphaproteobacteria bacterium SO-S41]